MRVRMTDRWCEAARPAGSGRVDFFDAVVGGLALRCSEGRKAWSLVFTAPGDGKRARVALGTYPTTTLAAARAKALEARGHVDAGIDPRTVLAIRAGDAMTVRDLVASYVDKHAVGLRSGRAIARRLHKNVVPAIGGVRLADLHKRDINRVVDPIIARRKPVEATRVFGDLRSALNWAVARGDLDHNPANGMRPNVPAAQARERVLGDDEIRTLWTSLPTALARSENCQRIIKLCLITAQRVGEVAGMRRDELDLAARLWLLPGARTKNKSPHTVPLSDLAVANITEALAAADGGPFVFPSGASSLAAQAVAYAIIRAQRRGAFGAIDHWTAHDLRRSALTGMAALGVTPFTIGHVANHRSTTRSGVTLQVYVRYRFDAEKRAALDLWGERLAAIITGAGAAVVPLWKGRV
jgi:integrase